MTPSSCVRGSRRKPDDVSPNREAGPPRTRPKRHCRAARAGGYPRAMGTSIPERGPFVLRARILTPLGAGGTRYEADGRLVVDAQGVITDVGPWDGGAANPRVAGPPPSVFDLRPLILMPGMVDLHVHLPQLPNAGVGAGLDVLTWLQRYTFPLEHAFD